MTLPPEDMVGAREENKPCCMHSGTSIPSALPLRHVPTMACGSWTKTKNKKKMRLCGVLAHKYEVWFSTRLSVLQSKNSTLDSWHKVVVVVLVAAASKPHCHNVDRFITETTTQALPN